MIKRIVTTALALLMLLPLLSGSPSLVLTVDSAPLKLSIGMDETNVTVDVITTQTFTLSNYDIQLEWNTAAFSIADISNGQPDFFVNFQKNTEAGKISATSSGNNVTVAAGGILATYMLTEDSGAANGVYTFSLYVMDAANEDGDSLGWKGTRFLSSVTLDGSEPAPVKLTVSEYEAEGTLRIALQTTEQIILSNYDVQLFWDTDAFTLNTIENCLNANFTFFQFNTTADDTNIGKISATSGGSNETVAPGKALATYTLSKRSPGLEGSFTFKLFVKDAADEDGNALAWKGSSVLIDYSMATPASAEIIRVQPQGAMISVTTICRRENARLFCAASKDNGQMIAVAVDKVIGDGTQRTCTLHFETADYCYVTVFLLSEDMTPLCNSVKNYR